MNQIKDFIHFFVKRRLIRYIISGGIATAVNVFTLFIFTEFFGVWYVAAGTLGFTLGILSSFLLQKFWTFQNNDSSFPASGRQFFFYFLTALGNLILNSFLIYIFADKFAVPYIVSALIASALIAVLSFFIYKVIFRAGGLDKTYKIQLFFRRHIVAFGLACLVLFLYGFGHILARELVLESGAVYYPVPVKGHFDEGGYVIRAARVFDGDLIIGDASLKEYSGSPSHLPILNPIILAVFGKIFGSFENGLIASATVLPAVSFFLIYLVAFELSSRRAGSAVFSSIFIIFPRIGLLPSAAAIPFLGEPAELYFSRFDYPAVTFPFFILALYFLARLLRRPSLLNGIALGVSFGLLFYTYFFDWVYMLVVVGLVLAGSFWLKLEKARWFLVIGSLTAFIMSIPYWLNYLSLRSLPYFQDIVERLGIERGRFFRTEVVWFSYVRAGILSGASYFSFRIKDRTKFLYSAALVLPIILLLNIQVITGFVPQPDHFHRTQFFGLALILWLIALHFYDKFSQFIPDLLRRGATIILIVVLFGYGFWTAKITATENFKLYAIDSAYNEAYGWLKSHTDKNSVVGALAPLTNEEVSLIARRFVFLPNGFLSSAPNDEIWQRLRIIGRTNGISSAVWRNLIVSDTHYFFSDFYHNTEFNSYFKAMKRDIPQEILFEEVAKYANTSTNLNNSYALDYVLIGPREISLGANPSLSLPAEAVYENGGVTIYKLAK